MPRVTKECFDWHVTWSPEEDVTELPGFLHEWMRSDDVKRCFAIAERHDDESKWHIHIGFRYFRSYKSDYKWWKPALDKAGFKEPALDIRYHDNLLGLVGGYCGKDKSRKILFNKGFNDEDLKLGAEAYTRGQRKQRVKKFLEKFNTINREKIDVAVGAMQAETNCSEKEALIELAEDGWAFATSSGKGFNEIYKEMYQLQRATEAPLL